MSMSSSREKKKRATNSVQQLNYHSVYNSLEEYLKGFIFPNLEALVFTFYF